MSGQTVAEKIISEKAGRKAVAGDIVEAEVDYVMVTDVMAPIVIRVLDRLGMPVVDDKCVLIPDHFVPNKDIPSAEQAKMMREFAKKNGICNYFEVGRGGICHQTMVEQGFAAPGRLIVGTDSHTASYGAVNCLSTGVGSTDAAVAMATGRLWFRTPESTRVDLTGSLRGYACGKDLIIRMLSDLGTEGASYRSLEFTEGATERLGMSDRLTVSNMAAEAGAAAAIFRYDRITAQHMSGVPSHGTFSPVSPDADATYGDSISFDLSDVEPMVACPFSPDNGRPARGLGVPIDQAYLGSCTNGRIEDMRQAAEVIAGRKVANGVRMIVVPASQNVLSEMAASGILEAFISAGAFVSGPTCGACVGGHMGVLADGEVAISTTNRNFTGRMGHRGSKVYLASPAVVAASAVLGHIGVPEELP